MPFFFGTARRKMSANGGLSFEMPHDDYVLAALAIATAAPAKPNFSGTWRLNKAKCNYAPCLRPRGWNGR